MPPLRQRLECIPEFVQHFVEKRCRKLGRPALQVSQGTLRDLQAHDTGRAEFEDGSVFQRPVCRL